MTPIVTGQCPDRARLEAFAAKPEDPAVRAHLDSCTACRRRIASIHRDVALIAEALAAAEPIDAPGWSGAPDEAIEGYRIVREVHRGGQGAVFEAWHLATKRRVALKVIARGRFATSTQRRRFEREIEIVASLRHPNLVTLYECGTTRHGAAFFAMEFIEGTSLDQSCDWSRADIPVTLRAFVKICRAVSYAHQRGLMHRDLKPANILVDEEREPHVVDFGLARPSILAPGAGDGTHVTNEAGFAGTFAYASPEQIGGAIGSEIDLRTDVYSLGLILQEMLTGVRPHAECSTVAELIAARSRSAPRLPPAMQRALGRDLETILQTAMAVDPERRYRSAAELADDLERRLDGRAIAARQDSLTYVLLKSAQRHRRAVTVAGGTVLLFIGVLIVIAGLFIKHEIQQDRAGDTLKALRTVLESADPFGGLSNGASIADFIDHAGRNVDRHLVDQPAIAATIESTLGRIALNMAEYDDAREHFEKAIALNRAAHPDEDAGQAEGLHNLGRALFYLGEYSEAETIYRQALQICQRVSGADHPDALTTTSHLASCLRRLGGLDEAEALFRDVLAKRRAAEPLNEEEVAASLNNLGSLLLDRGDAIAALNCFDDAILIVSELHGVDDWRVAHARRNRGTCLHALGRHEEAQVDLLEAERVWSHFVPEEHPAFLRVRIERARGMILQGDRSGGFALLSDSITALRRALGEHHVDVVEALRAQARSLELPEPSPRRAPFDSGQGN